MKQSKALRILIICFGSLALLSLFVMNVSSPGSVEDLVGQHSDLWFFLLSCLSFLGLFVTGVIFLVRRNVAENRMGSDKIVIAGWVGSMVICSILVFKLFILDGYKSLNTEQNSNAGTSGESSVNQGYYFRNVGNPEPEEFSSANWVMQPSKAVAIEVVEWSRDYDPSLTDLRDSIWWDFFEPQKKRAFSEREKARFVKDGFFLEATTPEKYVSRDDMIDSYNHLYTDGFGENYSTVPVFISSDFLLHVYHVVFDRLLQDVEERKFYFRLSDLTKRMVEASQKELDSVKDLQVKDAVLACVAYFSVAAKLIDTSFVVDARVTRLVNDEIEMIQSASVQNTSPILDEKQDYTQFKPRGHYTKSPRLMRYFETMMWYGKCSFSIKSRRSTLMALIISKLWRKSEIGDRWKNLVEPMNIIIGMPDDLSPQDYAAIAMDVYGSDLSEGNLLDNLKLDRFQKEAASRAHGKIEDESAGPTTEIEQAFRFLGQRSIPDSYIFTRLTSPRIGNDEKPRNMPKPLDIMAILGSPEAEVLVSQDFAIPGYEEALTGLSHEFANLPDKSWTQTVYWNWLNSLRAVVTEKDYHYPFFMRGQSWKLKSLLTGLASWSELRHDTILYSKQSGAEMGEGDEEIPPKPPQPKSYVEPDLQFFNRFISLVEKTGQTLSNNQLLSDEYLRKLSLFTDRLLKLREIARKELLNLEITHDEYEMLLRFSGDIGSIVIPDQSGDEIESKYKQMALVADVHTDNFSSRVLEVGVGVPQRIYVVVKDNSGGSRVCVGYVFSYYEFTQPSNKRLTDDEWKEAIYSGEEMPELSQKEPEWVKRLRVP